MSTEAATSGARAAQHRTEASVSRAGAGQLLRSEWVKFRSVRGWIVGMIVAGVLVVFIGVFLWRLAPELR